MPVARAAFAFLLDVGDLAARRHFAVATHDAPTGQRREAEQANQTHTAPSGDLNPTAGVIAATCCLPADCGGSKPCTDGLGTNARKCHQRDYRLIQRPPAA